jgi:hypothetical protein
VIGFQHGRCLICNTTLAATDSMAIDHVFPYSLMERATPLLQRPDLDLDAVWNLAPAHAACNADKRDRLPQMAETMRLAMRNAAIMSSPHPLRRTLQLTLQGHGFSGAPQDWGTFVTEVLSR